ncbi:MAG: 50S ribosomal protein L9 [Rhodovibrionaceae bacterium]
MEIILLERIEKLGQMGDVVKVKPGFARNFLLPQKKALRATKANMEVFESQRAQLETENLKRKEEAESAATKVEGMTVTMIRQAGDTGQLYGSVSARDIADALTEAGATVSRSQVLLDNPIKVLGLHAVRVRLHPEVSVTVTVNVARSETEAEVQAHTGHEITPEEQQAVTEAAGEEVIAAVEELEAAEADAEDAEVSAEAEDEESKTA